MADRAPIVVVSGLPRSGTSLAMQMLHAGGLECVTDGLRTSDTDNPRGYFEFERVKALKQDKGWLDDAAGKAVKIIHLLLTELPDDRPYRVVFMRRDLREVVKSQSTMLARSGRAGGGLPPERLMAVYQQQLKAVEQWLAARPGFQLLDVEYAKLVADPAAGVRAVNAFLGGTLDESKMAAAVDPSLHRNRA
ncbi:MAG: sulfotransferase [Phycisphaerales bacterium]